MSSIDQLSSSMYFSAAATVSRETQKQKGSTKTDKTKKTLFSSMVEKQQEIEELASAGLPPELAGLSDEEAVSFLKDAVDVAGDELEENMTAENFAKFRRSVSQFLKYIEKNNYEVAKIKRFGRERMYRGTSPFFAEKRKPEPYVQVQVVNKRLDELATMILQNHTERIEMLAKVDEIKGLIVDFFAA